MVGFHKSDPMTTNEKLLAGVFSGVMTRFITQPMDVIKVRAQLIKKAKRSNPVVRIGKKILFEEGLMAFWQGHTMGQVHSILAVSSQFYVYELTTRYASAHFDDVNKTFISLVSGAWAGCVSTTLVIPLEVIRVRQILLHDQYGGFLRGAKKVYKTGGISAFYEGLSASLLQMGPSVGISFTTFRVVQRLILGQFDKGECTEAQILANECSSSKGNPHKPQNLMLASTLAGSVAGFVSKTVTYPFDLAKRRLQMASHIADERYKIPKQVSQLIQCKTLYQCLFQAYKKEGCRGLFRGWSVTIYKAQITSIVAFTTYEMMCFVIRELHS